MGSLSMDASTVRWRYGAQAITSMYVLLPWPNQEYAVHTRMDVCCCGLQETTFERNSGQIGGAVMLAQGSSASFSFCKFMDNTAAVGSAMALRPGAKVDTILTCSFMGNWQQSEMRDPLTGRMIDPNRAYNEETLKIFAERCGAVALQSKSARNHVLL